MKKTKKLSLLMLAIMITFTLMACTSKENKKEDAKKGVKITDSYDREVSLEKIPERIVSLSPGATETIFALGKEAALVGRSDYDDYPKEALNITSVGGIQDPNVEKIAELKPELVIAGAHFPKETVKKLEDLGVKVAVLYGAENFDGAYKNITDISSLLNAMDKGQKIVDDMKKKVSEVEAKVNSLSKPKIYYVVGYGKTDFTAGGDTFIGQIIEKAGGDNVAKDVKGWSYSFEKIVENKPELLVVSDKFDTKKTLVAAERYKDLPAVKDGKVYEIDDNMLSRQGPRQADGLEALAKILHPEAFK